MKTKIKSALSFLGRSRLVTSVIALMIALLISSFIILFAGYDPLAAYATMFNGVFSSSYSRAQTIGTAMPLIFAGLAMTIASRVGVFNIGIEGQIIMGAFPAALVGHYITFLPRPLHILLCIVVAMLCAGTWAMIAGFLRNRLHVSEVIITIMLNYIALYFIGYLIAYPFHADAQMVRTENIQATAQLTTLVKNSRLNTGIFLALLVALAIWFLLNKTVFGYELRAVGANPAAAETAGIRQRKYVLVTMFMSGAIAGLAGACEVIGYGGYYATSMTTGYGFDGIAIAVMGCYSPFGTVLAALVFGALRIGAASMNLKTGIPSEFVKVLQAMIIIFISTPGIVLTLKKIGKRKKPAPSVEKEAH